MSKMKWDQVGERRYETGVEQVALFPKVEAAYPAGVPWNGVTALNITPSGAESTKLYANDKVYLNLQSKEEIGGTIEAYMYPDEFTACDGSAEVVKGVYVGQQTRQGFGLVGKTLIGNDTQKTKYGYFLHIIYDALASVSEQSNATVNETPEGKTMSWEFSTTAMEVEGFEPTSYIKIDSTKVDAEKLAALEAIIYGGEGEQATPRLPLPEEVFTTLGWTKTQAQAEG